MSEGSPLLHIIYQPVWMDCLLCPIKKAIIIIPMSMCLPRNKLMVKKKPVLKGKVKVLFQRVLAIFLLKLCLKLIVSEEKMRKMPFGLYKIIGPRPLGEGGGGCAPPDPLVFYEPFDLETEIAQYEFQMKQSFIYQVYYQSPLDLGARIESKPHINSL